MRHSSHDKIKQKIFVLLPPYGWLILFFLVPFLLVLLISFSEIADGVPPYTLFFGHDASGAFYFKPYSGNYKLLVTDPLYIGAYLKSLQIAGISTIIALIVSYPIAYGITQVQPNLRNILLLLVLIPFWTALLIRVYAWITLLKGNGLINQWLISLGIIHEPLEMMNTKGAVVLGIVYSYLPFMILPIYLALEKIPPALLEAAEDLGCRPLKVFLRVTLPLSIPGMIAGSMLVFVPAVGEFVIPDLLGGSRVLTIGKVLWNEFFLNRDWPTAAAVTIVMTLILVVPIMIIQRIIGKKEQAA